MRSGRLLLKARLENIKMHKDKWSAVYFAHSGLRSDKSDWQTLQDHLEVVAERSKHNARYFGGQELAYLAGLLHDLGNTLQSFKRVWRVRLRGWIMPRRVQRLRLKLCRNLGLN